MEIETLGGDSMTSILATALGIITLTAEIHDDPLFYIQTEVRNKAVIITIIGE